MSKIYFYYGCMNSGKSSKIIMDYYNMTFGKPELDILVLKSIRNDRTNEEGVISSRAISSSLPCSYFEELQDDDYIDIMNGRYDYIFIDEAQFLTNDDVVVLRELICYTKTKVFCYGLKNTYKGDLFDGALALMKYADKIREIPSQCYFCENKATMHILCDEDGETITEGENIVIGDTDVFYSVCPEHFIKKHGAFLSE